MFHLRQHRIPKLGRQVARAHPDSPGSFMPVLCPGRAVGPEAHGRGLQRGWGVRDELAGVLAGGCGSRAVPGAGSGPGAGEGQGVGCSAPRRQRHSRDVGALAAQQLLFQVSLSLLPALEPGSKETRMVSQSQWDS